MHKPIVMGLAAVAGLATGLGCVPVVDTSSGSTQSAAIVGTITASGPAARAILAAQTVDCPEVLITLNGSPASIDFDDDCTFLVTDFQPTDSIVLRVELPALGLSGTIEIDEVGDAELIEILVDAGDESLSLSVLRRATPEPVDAIPYTIVDNDVSLQVPAGVYEQDLTVLGNNFTLVGEAGDDCESDGWTVITGDVLISGNNATFRNIAFEGSVEIRGNSPTFINCCFDNAAIVFGNNVQIEEE